MPYKHASVHGSSFSLSNPLQALHPRTQSNQCTQSTYGAPTTVSLPTLSCNLAVEPGSGIVGSIFRLESMNWRTRSSVTAALRCCRQGQQMRGREGKREPENEQRVTSVPV